MSRPEKDDKASYSLFAQEEEVIARAEDMIAKLNQVAQGVKDLAAAYHQQLREQQRMVRLSDRMQLDLQMSKQRLEDQADELLALNKALTEEIKQRELLEAHLRVLATTDPLTGLYSRLHFFELSQREVRRLLRKDGPLSLVVIDLDEFKDINDRFGHPAGDEALKQFADICRSNLRETDIAGRLGGEEFAVLLPDTGVEHARDLSDRLRKKLADTPLRLDGEEITLTASFGVTSVKAGDDGLRDAYQRADKALYRAKAQGRNQVVVWEAD